jgi:hypothetical protein
MPPTARSVARIRPAVFVGAPTGRGIPEPSAATPGCRLRAGGGRSDRRGARRAVVGVRTLLDAHVPLRSAVRPSAGALRQKESIT